MDIKEMDMLSYFKSILRRCEEDFDLSKYTFLISLQDSQSNGFMLKASWLVKACEGSDWLRKSVISQPFIYANHRFVFDYERFKRQIEEVSSSAQAIEAGN